MLNIFWLLLLFTNVVFCVTDVSGEHYFAIGKY